MAQFKPFIGPDERVAELTIRSIVLAVLLTIILAMSNAYLALKLGILTSASIPAAILSMGILRMFKNASILENNAVQTAASAGEAVAGGIVYTIPALVIIHFWQGFDYLTNFFIALTGGVLGVLFSIPLRRVLVNEPMLRFPEGRAIAEVLMSSVQRVGVRDIVLGGGLGAMIELLQLGFRLVASSWNYWFFAGRALIGFGAGFSATMIGAGFLVGPEMAASIFLGALISWFFAMPLVSPFYPKLLQAGSASEAASLLWNSEMRYIGIGAMLFAGTWTFLRLARPLARSIQVSFSAFMSRSSTGVLPRTERDIPLPFILGGILLMAAVLFLFFQVEFPLEILGLDGDFAPSLVFGAVLYVLVFGFLFSVFTGYFSGMVGVTASPGSSVVIAGMLFAAWLLQHALQQVLGMALTPSQLRAAEAITIMIGSVVTGIAAISNDNMQDLKVGQLVGATPWCQQLMLLIGVVVSALVIPPVMQILFDVYGIAGVMPREGMDASLSLPAPTAALMAAITEAVFQGSLPWGMMLGGCAVIIALLMFIRVFRLDRFVRLSILGVAIGMYLPLSSSFPLFVGGMFSLTATRFLARRKLPEAERAHRAQTGILLACGLVAGSALMDVLLAVPFSLMHSPDALRLAGPQWEGVSIVLGILTTLLLGAWMVRRVQGP